MIFSTNSVSSFCSASYSADSFKNRSWRIALFGQICYFILFSFPFHSCPYFLCWSWQQAQQMGTLSEKCGHFSNFSDGLFENISSQSTYQIKIADFVARAKRNAADFENLRHFFFNMEYIKIDRIPRLTRHYLKLQILLRLYLPILFRQQNKHYRHTVSKS